MAVDYVWQHVLFIILLWFNEPYVGAHFEYKNRSIKVKTEIVHYPPSVD